MAVVRNLMIRIGADYSAAKKGLEGASKSLQRFKTDATRSTAAVQNSFNRLKGPRGAIGGVANELRTLKPTLISSRAGMVGLGVAATAMSASLGVAGVAIAGVATAITLATAAMYKFSQPAVRFEADLGRLNISLKEGSRAYTEWAAAQGLAKSTAVELGATYGNLLGSFIKDTKQLQQSTQDLVHATRVISSFTGRSMDDVFNRIRSGMLGSTEAIEDLGVYVNISMIESTRAFRKFAGDKSWAQLDFQTQQQIRLAAILEQTYERYGNELQRNVMTKQELLMEQLKDLKLNWSQSFMPVWDTVIPALTRLAQGVSWVVEQFARLAYWVKGWDYDEMTKGTDKQTGAVGEQGDAFEDLEKKAESARKELASFDRLNLIGGTGDGGTGGSGGFGGDIPGWPSPLKPSDNLELPEFPEPQIVFKPPTPPDAGMGAVATAVVDTVDGMARDVNRRYGEMWGSLNRETLTGETWQRNQWMAMTHGLSGVIVPSMTGSVVGQWSGMWGDINAQTVTGGQQVQSTLMSLGNTINQGVRTSTKQVSTDWRTMLDTMKQDMYASQPTFEAGVSVFGNNLRSLQPVMRNTEATWADVLTNMAMTANAKYSSMVSDINRVIDAQNKLNAAMGAKPAPVPVTPSIPAPAPMSTPLSSVGSLTREASQSVRVTPQVPVMDEMNLLQRFGHEFMNQLRRDGYENITDMVMGEAMKAAAAVGPAGKTGAVKKAVDVIKSIPEWLKGLGKSIPVFASGASVRGPTLAMIGEYTGARSNPEIVAPKSDMIDAVRTAMNSDAIVSMLARVEAAVRDLKYLQAVISYNDVGRAATDFIRDEHRRGKNPLPAR